MDLEAITFPALVVADDGWVDQLGSKEELSTMTHAALKKYSKRRVVLYDSRDHAWQIDSFTPLRRQGIIAKLFAAFSNPKVPVRVDVRPITKAPLQATRAALAAAIDADDDILTQFTTAADLKNAIGQAQSFEGLLGILKTNRAI
jgi:hypothetical protein